MTQCDHSVHARSLVDVRYIRVRQLPTYLPYLPYLKSCILQAFRQAPGIIATRRTAGPGNSNNWTANLVNSRSPPWGLRDQTLKQKTLLTSQKQHFAACSHFQKRHPSGRAALNNSTLPDARSVASNPPRSLTSAILDTAEPTNYLTNPTQRPLGFQRLGRC